MASSRILLVEGLSDQNFFFEIARKLEISAEVRVTAPTDHGGTYNTKGGVLNTLPLLVRQLNDGALEHVAAVVDADHDSNHGLGYEKTLEKFSKALSAEGFIKRTRVGEQGGFSFIHQDGLNPIGLWIMPDNQSDGGLEELVIRSAIESEKPALNYAKELLLKVPGGTKYSKYRCYKAQAAAWMAWQAVPGQGLQQAVREELVDMSMPLTLRLISWLKTIFP